jgi:hypothetical protein
MQNSGRTAVSRHALSTSLYHAHTHQSRSGSLRTNTNRADKQELLLQDSLLCHTVQTDRLEGQDGRLCTTTPHPHSATKLSHIPLVQQHARYIKWTVRPAISFSPSTQRRSQRKHTTPFPRMPTRSTCRHCPPQHCAPSCTSPTRQLVPSLKPVARPHLNHLVHTGSPTPLA